jgi:hypothetical protein
VRIPPLHCSGRHTTTTASAESVGIHETKKEGKKKEKKSEYLIEKESAFAAYREITR